MPMIINREYCELGNSKSECYTLNGEIIIDLPELITKLKAIGVDISLAQMKFIKTKHRVPKDIYKRYGFQYNDKISGIPTNYPAEDNHYDPTENPDPLHIEVRAYKVDGVIDHCHYQVGNRRYIRLHKLYEDLNELGFHFTNMQQLRNCIHRGISNNLRARYPNLTVSIETIED